MSVKLHPVVKKQWLEALRSGKYIQGKGELRSMDNRFCCLGVLCDLHSKEFKIEWKPPATNDSVGYRYGGSAGVQPPDVTQWAMMGAEDAVPRVIIDGLNRRLDGHNDDGYTFEEIANAIEEQL